MKVDQLIISCRKGDNRAQKALFGRYCGMLFLLCKRYINDHHHAEDAMLRSFTAIFSALNKFTYHDEPRMVAWMKQIAINECLMHLRSSGRKIIGNEVDALDVSVESDSISRLSVTEIYHLIATLPDGYRIVFNLYVIEEYSHKEISDILGITPQTSRSQLLRARSQLKKMIKSEQLL